MAIQIGATIVAELANGVRDVLRQGAAVLGGNQGDYIRNGEPESIYGRLQQATARQYCRRYADEPGSYGDRTRVFAENICRPYLDDIGYGAPGSIAKPFSGGQCAGTNYRAFGQALYTLTNCSNGGVFPDQPADVTTEFQFVGPIVSVTPEYSGSVSCGQNQFVFRIVFDGGAQNSTFGFVSNPVNALSNARFVGTFEAAPGSPSDCGSPPPIITDPIPPVTPGPRFEPFNPSPDINIDIGVEINPDGTINIDFGTGPVTIDPFSDGDGDGGGGGLPPGDTGTPGTPEDTGAGGDAEGEAPPGSVLVGLQMNLTSAPSNAKEYAPGIYRGGAYIYMGGDGGLDQDFSGSMLSDGQFVFAEKENLTRWRVRANVSYNWLVIPFYREVE